MTILTFQLFNLMHYNTSWSNGNGGGVWAGLGTFIMNGGTISGNTAGDGGGVYGSTFTMNGGTISGNTARGNGGGIYVRYNYSSFTKTGGTIEQNQAKNNRSGHNVFVASDNKRRNSTAGKDVNLNSEVKGRAGGWE